MEWVIPPEAEPIHHSTGANPKMLLVMLGCWITSIRPYANLGNSLLVLTLNKSPNLSTTSSSVSAVSGMSNEISAHKSGLFAVVVIDPPLANRLWKSATMLKRNGSGPDKAALLYFIHLKI